jgi:hypothetical protein
LKDFIQTGFQFEGLFQDGDEQVSAERSPNLDKHSVLGGADEGTNPEMSLDPFEKQFDLPAGAVNLAHLNGGQAKVIGEENEPARMLGVVITDATQGLGIALLGIKAAESNRLIAPQAFGRVDRTALDHLKLQFGFAAEQKKSARLSEAS